ncbi:CASP-like protein 4B2 [Silene latifolia]|uniref:CASP-like protein 4B2 n=1 Tax=Silene latifolia TaxID=37657 RepID=UPI003D776527
MQKNNPNNHHKPPHPPPLSISLPTPTRPEPNPEPELDSFPNSPLQSSSSHRSDDPEPEPISKNDTALVVVENYYSPLTSPFPLTPPNTTTPTSAAAADEIPLSPTPQTMLQFSRREEAPPQSGVLHGVVEGGGGGERKGRKVRWRKKEVGVGVGRGGGVVERVGLGIRVLEIVFCLISFSVMASDKTQGWSGDSFDRYKEYRFCLTMAIFGFVYSAFQAYDLGSYLATGKHVIKHRLRYQFDFIMDQILAYLLISASSAAASRVDDWQANWGKDEFTAKASGSISMAFLAFICFAVSSIISGYNLCNPDN